MTNESKPDLVGKSVECWAVVDPSRFSDTDPQCLLVGPKYRVNRVAEQWKPRIAARVRIEILEVMK